MAIQIGAKPDSGFDDPIGMLKDCHRRIVSFLGILALWLIGRRAGILLMRSAMQLRLRCSTSEQADNATRRMRKNHSFHDCASLMRNPLKRSTGLRRIITRQTICMDQSTGFIRLGLSRAA